jgi:hypothetical protein
VIANPDSLDGWVFADWLTLEVEVDDELAAREPFTRLGRIVSQRDFPAIVDEIRRQVHAEFGPDADRIQ